MNCEGKVVDRADLRGARGVFADRDEAGRVLAGMLGRWSGTEALVLAIPAGGVPVATVLAAQLGLEIGVTVVSKITLPWSKEVGYGAVAFDGAIALDEDLISRVGLSMDQVGQGIDSTRMKVRRRLRRFGAFAAPTHWDRPVILVDDGLASGCTMCVAVEAVRRAGATRVMVAVPTGHDSAVHRVAALADGVFCANLRGGCSFAVADAYRRWSDVDEGAALTQLLGTREPSALIS